MPQRIAQQTDFLSATNIFVLRKILQGAAVQETPTSLSPTVSFHCVEECFPTVLWCLLLERGSPSVHFYFCFLCDVLREKDSLFVEFIFVFWFSFLM